MIEPKIFREYDIRGVWGRDLTREAVMAIGKAFACYLSDNLVPVRCVKPSRKLLQKAAWT
jgi:phosphomannomutase